MEQLNISPNFTIEDIHKIREYNYEKTKNMNLEEIIFYYNKTAEELAEEFPHIKKSFKNKGA